jgi:hypothetical protein
MITRAIVGVLAIGAVVLAACGPSRASTPATPGVMQGCQQICEKAKQCGDQAGADPDHCVSNCSSLEAARRIETFKPEAIQPMWDCIGASFCSKDRRGAGARCVHEVAQKLPLSPKVKALCAKLEYAFSSCEFSWKTPCSEELRFFPDADLDGFNECIDRPCRSGSKCVNEAEEALVTKHH